jgi:hypothetical protein
MSSEFVELVNRWCDACEVVASLRPDPHALVQAFPDFHGTCRPGISTNAIQSWEHRHGFPLPTGLKAWLLLSNGFFTPTPLIHPLGAIGPMVPFARIPGLLVQPESWFELGNPNRETICLDLGYRVPSSDYPIFTSGDDEQSTRPRIIATDFVQWFLNVLRLGGREFWFEGEYAFQGDPWEAHCRHVPVPPIADRLSLHVSRVVSLLDEGMDDRAVANRVSIARSDVEAIARHAQHMRLLVTTPAAH